MLPPSRGRRRYHQLESPQLTVLPSKYNGRRPSLQALLAPASLVFLCVVVAPAPARAQWVLGPWDDASVAPRGTLRAGISTSWTHANERFRRSGTNVETLGADFTRDSLGPAAIPLLGSLRTPLQSLTGLANPPLSLGRLHVDLEATAYVTPITLEYGVTSRLSLGVVVPYVKTRAEILANMNPNGPEGTLGLNPAYAVVGARTTNSQVVTQLQAAAMQVESELARCLNDTSASCMAINADRQAAADLATTATSTAGLIAAIYGTDVAKGSPFAPVGHTVLQTAVETRLTNMDAQFLALLGAPTGGGAAWIGARPVGAPPLAYAGLQHMLTDSAVGIAGVPLTDIERSHIGDIEVGGKLVLFDTFGSASVGAPPRGLGARAAIAASVRLATAQHDTPNDFADIGTGDRQNDVEVRGYLDLLAGHRWWASLIGRYGVQRPDRLTLRVPAVVGEPFPPLASEREVGRDLGDYMEVEVAPRWAPNDALSFSADYRYRSKQADRYTGAPFDIPDLAGGSITLLPALLGQFTAQKEQRVGVALTFSTVRQYELHRAPWPLEVSLFHTQVLAGQGVPKTFATAVSLRLYHSLFGSDRRAPARRGAVGLASGGR